MVKSTKYLVTSRLKSLKEEMTIFLQNYCSIHLINNTFDPVIFISPNGNHWFNPIPSEGIQQQNLLLQKFDKLSKLIEAIIDETVETQKDSIKENLEKIKDLIMQNKATWYKSASEAIKDVNDSIDNVVNTFCNIFPASNEEAFLVVDSNALYDNPDIETWQFTDINRFVIVLPSSILTEIDRHKIEHKNEQIRKKALKIINKIKEYRRRGKLTEGITIVKNHIKLLGISVEPNFESSLPWLDPNNDDDKIIATTIELMRTNADKPIIVISSDINLQNKCEFAEIPYNEPPTI